MRNGNVALDDPTSYEEFSSAHHRQVLRICRLLLTDRHEAEEVAQEVFLKMFRAFQNQDHTQTMDWRPWLAQVSVNACRDRQRTGWWKWWRPATIEYREADHPSKGRTPEEEVLSRELQRHLWSAFRKLSARQQEVFALRHIAGFSTKEVAETLRMTTGSVKRHLFRAVHQLRRMLGDHL